MKKVIPTLLTAIIVIAALVFGILSGFSLDELQKDTLVVLMIICGVSILYCFVVGEISRNNSQMDKLWSILPIAYVWVIAIKGSMSLRLIIAAVLVTFWGVRLTYNFAKKGAYSIKFWTGEEDYRWKILRETKYFKSKFVWGLFDLFFISIYQNVLVLLTCLPLLAAMSSAKAFNWIDAIAAVLTLFFIVYELIADKQQMKFQTTKWNMIHEGKKLEELPEPYNLGFNTTGLWKYSRHPNYCGEQATWICIYIFAIGAGVCKWGIFNWTIIGAGMLVLLFMGSSMFAEIVSSKKYPLYKDYQEKVFKYIPFKSYK